MKISSCFKQQKTEIVLLTLIDGMPAILFAIGYVDHFGFYIYFLQCIILLLKAFLLICNY